MPAEPGDNATGPETPETASEPAPADAPKPKRPRVYGPRTDGFQGQRKRELKPKRKGQRRNSKVKVSPDEEHFGKVSKKILDGIRMGLAEYVAAHAANVSPRTHRRWKQEGRAAFAKAEAGEALTAYEQRLSDYWEGCNHGAAVTEHRALSAIQSAMEAATQVLMFDGAEARDIIDAMRLSAQASQWMLTHNRRYNDGYGTKTRTEVTGKDGGAIKTESKIIDVTKLTDAELDKLAGATDPSPAREGTPEEGEG